MSPTLRTYVMKLYLGAVAVAAAAVLVIFLVIDFGDRLKLYVGHSFAQVFDFYLCKTAVTLGQLMPAAMLLGAGVALTVLKRRGELDAMRALGISPAAIVMPMLWCAAPLAGLLVFWDEGVAAPAGARGDRMMVETFGIWGDYRHYYGNQQWLRLGPDVFRLTNSSVTVFHVTKDFALGERTDATAMRPLENGAFELDDARVRDYSDGAQHLRTAAKEQRRFEQADPRAFEIRPGKPEQMSSSELHEQVRLRAAAGLPTVRLTLARYGRYSYPFLGAVGALLAAALALRPRRRAGLTVALVEGLVVCSTMWGLLVIGRALALSERLPPALATWGPLLALGVMGLGLLHRVQKSS